MKSHLLQICEGIQNDDWEVVNPNPGRHGPYAHTKDGLWVGYDDEEIAREKVLNKFFPFRHHYFS